MKKELLAILTGLEKVADRALTPAKDALDALLKEAHLRNKLTPIPVEKKHPRKPS